MYSGTSLNISTLHNFTTTNYLILQFLDSLSECVNGITVTSGRHICLGGMSFRENLLSFWISIQAYHLSCVCGTEEETLR